MCKPPPSSLPSTTRDNLNASVNRQQMALTASPSKTLSGGDGQRPTSMDRSLVAPSSPMAHGGGRQLMGQPMGPNQRRAPGPPLPRPVLPRERGYMDKVVEYLVGDGPSNRFALICKQCQSHNGMALREEFEYIGKSHFSNNIIFSCKELKFTGIHPNKLIFLCTSVESRNRFQLIIIHQLLRDLGCLQGF